MNATARLVISPEVLQRRQERKLAGRVRLLRSIHESGLMKLQPDDPYRERQEEFYRRIAQSDERTIEIAERAHNAFVGYNESDYVVYPQLLRLDKDPDSQLLPHVEWRIIMQKHTALVDCLAEDALHSLEARVRVFRHFVLNNGFYRRTVDGVGTLLQLRDGMTAEQYLAQLNNRINKVANAGVKAKLFGITGSIYDEQREHAVKAIYIEQFGSE